MRLKVSSAKWRPCCLGLNVLNTDIDSGFWRANVSTSKRKKITPRASDLKSGLQTVPSNGRRAIFPIKLTCTKVGHLICLISNTNIKRTHQSTAVTTQNSFIFTAKKYNNLFAIYSNNKIYRWLGEASWQVISSQGKYWPQLGSALTVKRYETP